MSKRYKNYKPSGVDWIGDVPAHWQLLPLKRAAETILGKMLTPDEKAGFFLKKYLRAQNVQWLAPDLRDIKGMWFSLDELQKLRVREGDLLVSEGGEVGRTCIWSGEIDECYVQNSVHIVRFKEQHIPRFFLYHFYASGTKGYFDSIVNRISIAHLTGEKLREIRVVVPPRREQEVMADFLDQKTTLIDATIQKKQRLIELLQEERTALINHAVTRGLNPDVPMKPSGVEWLGDVPAHWEVKRLKFLVRLRNEKTQDGQHLTIALENIEGKTGRLLPATETNLEGDLKKFEKDDVLFNKLRPYLAKVIQAPTSGRCVGELLVLIPQKLISRFLFYRLLSSAFIKEVDSSTYGSKMPRASWEDFISLMRIPYPGNHEQEEIVKWLDNELDKIEKVSLKIEQEIALLKEYRTALINEVVTGKRCVVPQPEPVYA